MSSSIAMIVGGTLLIAIGGLLATFGWNSHADDARRHGLVEQIAAELTVNLNVASDPKFVENDPEELKEYVVYPRFQIVALDAAIASGLFLENADRELLTRISGVSELLRDFNNRLNITEAQTAGASQADRVVWRTTLRDGETRKGIDQRLKSLGALLLQEYGIKEDRQFFVELADDAA